MERACSEIISNRYANNLKKNQEKHCWTFLKPFFQLFPWYITIYTTVTYCREGGSLFQIFFHIPNCSSYFTIFFQSNNQKQMPLELEFLTIEQDCFTKCEVSFLQILLFHLRNPILKKTDLVFPLKLSDMLEFWLYNPQKSPILESFKG